MEIPREKVQLVAREILSSSLPVDDILIDEVGVESVIERVFRKSGKTKVG